MGTTFRHRTPGSKSVFARFHVFDPTVTVFNLTRLFEQFLSDALIALGKSLRLLGDPSGLTLI